MAVGVTFATPSFFAALVRDRLPSERERRPRPPASRIDLGLGLGPILMGLVANAYGIPWAFVWAAASAGLAGPCWTSTSSGTRVRR